MGHAHGGGPPQAETSTRTAQRPAIFQAGLWGIARPKPGLHGTLLREFPKSSFKQEISARPAPFRPARPPTSRRATDIPKGAHSPRQTTGTVSYETIPVFFSAAYPARSGLERVDVQLERAFQVTGLVLVDDVVLGQLVQHRRYLGQQRFGSALLAGIAQRLHRIARRLVIETVVRTFGNGLANPLLG